MSMQMEDAVNQQLLAYKQANPDASEAELAAVTEKAQAAVEAATLEKVTAAIKSDETTMAYITSEVTKAVETGIRAEVEKEVDTQLADAYQVVVNGTHGKERRYSHMLIVYITVGKDDIVVAIVNTLSSLLA